MTGADYGNFANASALKAALLENYDLTQPPPRANSTRGVVVRVQFALQQFTQLDTTNQRITFFAWWRHYWVDPRLAWNPDDWGGVTELQFVGAGEQQDAWQPDTIIYEVTTCVEIKFRTPHAIDAMSSP